MQYGFSFDLSRCSGCMACVVACMDENDIPGDRSSFRQVIKLEQGAYPLAKLAFVTLACFQCSDAPCANVCPKGAISREEESSIVRVDEALCIGCRACAMVCPYGAPRFFPGEKMKKCDFCHDRVAQGMEPACVRTCTTRALGFGTLEELSRKQGEKASIRIFKGLESTGP